MRSASDVHVFDEANLGAVALAELDQIGQLVVVGPTDDDRIDLQTWKEGSGCRDSLENPWQFA